MAKRLSPKNAKTTAQLCELNRDNSTCGDFWMLAGGDEVYLSEQAVGSAVKQKITIPREVFIRLVNWYQRPQKIRQRKRSLSPKEQV